MAWGSFFTNAPEAVLCLGALHWLHVLNLQVTMDLKTRIHYYLPLLLMDALGLHITNACGVQCFFMHAASRGVPTSRATNVATD